MPLKYLSKKKKAKIEGQNKPKLPSVGTSDAWWKIHLAKEEEIKKKEEKTLRKKSLQEKKKILAEEKKLLQKKMKEIQEAIKKESK